MNRFIASFLVLLPIACGAPDSPEAQEPEGLGIVSRPAEAAELSPSMTGTPPELGTTEVDSQLTLDLSESRVEGAIARPRAHRLYTFTVDHRRLVTVNVEGDGLNPTVELVDESGERVAFDDDSGEGTNARISLQLDVGNYDIVVRGSNRSTGSFYLTLR